MPAIDSPAQRDALLAITGRVVMPIVSPPLDGGVVRIIGDKIVGIGPRRSDDHCLDLGDVAILPGFINAHTHLELSDLTAPLGMPGEPLARWVKRVIEHRRKRRDSAATLEIGRLESQQAGATTVVDIVQFDWTPTPGMALREFKLWELIGLSFRRGNEALDRAAVQVAAETDDTDVHSGLSPHAPYSVHPEVVARSVKFAAQRRAVVAMHVAESEDERELLARGTGPLREFLDEIGAWDSDAFRPGARPLDFLRVLAGGHKSLVVHGNYLDREERAFLADQRDRLSLVHCPRTCAFFGHPNVKLTDLASSGARVCLGTDSRASNPDLSVLAEARHVSRAGQIAPRAILEMITSQAALALGIEDLTGSLAVGLSADLAIVELSTTRGGDPYEWVLNGDSQVRSTMFRGRWTTPQHS